MEPPSSARNLVVALRRRRWDGDDELADQLDALLGSGPAPMLRGLPVDLEELAGILEGDPLSTGGLIDIRTGEVWAHAAIEYAVETGDEDADTADDLERWLPVHGEGSREGYRDMELFIASVEDPGRAERLRIAINGRGGFRRFKDELAARSASLSDGTPCPRSASAAEPGRGSPRLATACFPPTTTIPETRSSPRHRSELTHGSRPPGALHNYARQFALFPKEGARPGPRAGYVSSETAASLRSGQSRRGGCSPPKSVM